MGRFPVTLYIVANGNAYSLPVMRSPRYLQPTLRPLPRKTDLGIWHTRPGSQPYVASMRRGSNDIHNAFAELVSNRVESLYVLEAPDLMVDCRHRGRQKFAEKHA